MICPLCQNQNRADALFCDQCGARLETVCRQCSAANRPAAKFCSNCGQSLSSQPAAQQPHPAPALPADTVMPKHLAEKILAGRHLLAGERKKITVLFADIRGSTRLVEGLDPEAAQLLIDPILHIMMDAVHLYEGTVNQVLGDGIMALFGAPIAHEDHALRACYAALAMQKELRAHHEKLGQSESQGVQIGVGLNTGEVVVRSIDSDLHLDYSALGHTTHLAARMQELAGGGIALMTAATLREVEGFIQIQARGAVNAKGVSQPVEVFELVAATSARTRVQAALASGLTPFVGRQVEIELFDKLIDRTERGRGQILAMVGEPGMGKSRLVYEFTRFHLPTGWLVAEGAAVSYGKATPYFPLIELLRRYFAIAETDRGDRIQANVISKVRDLDAALNDVIAPILSLLGALPEILPNGVVEQGGGLSQFPGTLDTAKAFIAMEPQQRRSFTLDTLTRLWLRESQRQPLLLVFEDLQWLDSETEAFLDRLVESLADARICLLVNYRPSYSHDWTNKDYYSHLRLEPLQSLNAEELLNHLLGSNRDLADLTRLLIERTDGNPFFAEETVRALVETGVLVGAKGAYRPGLKIANMAIPSTVQNVVAGRIDRLPLAEKQLLQTAAVIGMTVPFPLLRAVAGLSEESLKIALGHLQAAEFLYEASLFPELEFAFKHALICEVAYGALLRERRSLLHAQVLTALEHLRGTTAHDHVEKLAHHAVQGELWDKAVDYLGQAANKAVAGSANREAADFYYHSLAALQHLPQTADTLRRAVDVRLELRNPLFLLGQFEELHRNLREAEAVAEKIGDQKRLGRLLNFLIAYYGLVGEHGRAIEAGARGLQFNQDDLELNTVTHYYMGQAYHHMGQYRQAIAQLNQTRNTVNDERYKYSRFGTASVISVICRIWLAQCYAQLGEFDDGIATAEESIRIAQESEHAYSLAYAHGTLGFVWLLRGDIANAIGALERSQTICESKDLRVLMTHIGSNLGYAYALAGRYDEALPLMEKAEARSESIGRKAAWALRLTWLGQTLRLAGQSDSALEQGKRALEFASHAEERGYQAWALKLLGDVAQAQDLDRARGYYDQAMTLAMQLAMRPLQAHLHLRNGRTAQQAQDNDTARGEFSTACELYRDMKMPFWLNVAQKELDGLTAAQHRTEANGVNPNIQVSAAAASRTPVAPDNPFTPFAAADIEQSLASRFEQMVGRDPAQLAVKTAHESVSYGALNRMANRIAHRILSMTDASNTPVAVVVENNIATIAAILGVLKAGKIFVPLDVAYSPAWAQFILSDTDSRIVLGGKSGLRQTKPWFSAQQSLIDLASVGAEWSAENPVHITPPEALCHILYTSGSTGHPKGVMDDQRNTLHYVMRLTNASHISAADRLTLVRPPSSSGALMNLYLALLNGSTLFPIELKQVGMNGLAAWLQREALTILHCGGTVFRHFAQQLQGSEEFPHLRLIRLSSGQVQRQDIELFKRHFPAALLLHVLSSTEANTYRVHFVDKDSPLPEGPLPVGYPVQDMEVLIVDDDGKPLAENHAGEIAIRSAYLFPGYWNNGALTRAAFVDARDSHGRRTFRTGDLGRLHSDHCLEYLGRKDFRLKIRGYSIQAEQVETALLEIPAIAQAAVAAHKDSYGDDRLVAYLAAEPNQLPTISQLRVMLNRHLPDYMIPSRFVTLTSLPLHPNGKVNRQALPAPDSARPQLETAFAAPSTPLQEVIAKICCEALGVNQIGIDDGFFDLGGDSLIAGRMLTRLGRIFPWPLTLPEFYDAPTVAQTAQLILRKAPSGEIADQAAQLALAVDKLSAAEVAAMIAAQRNQRP